MTSLYVSVNAYATEGGLDGRYEPATCFNPMIALGRLPGPSAAAKLWQHYPEAIDLAIAAGVTHLRIDLSWARLEPTLGVFDEMAFDHYRDMLERASHRGLIVGVGTCDGAWPAWLGLEPWLWEWSESVTMRYIKRLADSFAFVDAIEFTPTTEYVRGGFLTATGPPWRRDAGRDAAIAIARLASIKEECATEGFIRPFGTSLGAARALLAGAGPLAQPNALRTPTWL